MATTDDRAVLATRLAAAGFVAAADEAEALLACAAGDAARLEALVSRRLAGEPLAWVTGRARFAGIDLRIDPGVYVPRPQSELLARRALARLPAAGRAVDVCTGCGAVAAVLARHRPRAQVVGTDADPRAVACATANGVDARRGDLLDPVPPTWAGRVDVVVGVVPYVPTPALALLHHDALAFEARAAFDGGPDGTVLLRRAVVGSRRVLRPGGVLLLELGGDQADLLADELTEGGFARVQDLVDEEGDLRGVEAVLTPGG